MASKGRASFGSRLSWASRWKRRGARDRNSRQGNGLEIPKVLGREFLHIPHPPSNRKNLKGIERVNFEIIINLRMTKTEET